MIFTVKTLNVLTVYYSATCTLPNKVIDGKFVVDDLEKEVGESTPFGSTVTLLCNEGYKFNDSRSYSMDCKGTDSHFYNECYSKFSPLLVTSSVN